MDSNPVGAQARGSRQATPPAARPTAPEGLQSKSRLCRFYGTRSGCRAGESCRFVHDATKAKQHDGQPKPASSSAAVSQQDSKDTPSVGGLRTDASQQSSSGEGSANNTISIRQPPGVNPAPSRVVQRPVPRAQEENPREFQLGQLRRRFNPQETKEANGSTLAFKLRPTDPDFPFEVDYLECALHVPTSYPSGGKPTLRVNNDDLDRGYQINVERGFDALASNNPNATLLGLTNRLDKELESLLSASKAEVVNFKLVANDFRPTSLPVVETNLGISRDNVAENQRIAGASREAPPSSRPANAFGEEQKTQARQKRALETRQLEARLGRLGLFSKSSDGFSYAVPIGPNRRSDLPVPLREIKRATLFVPDVYPLSPCTLELLDVETGAAPIVEAAFLSRARQHPEISLMGHMNYLSQHMHTMVHEEQDTHLGKPRSEPGAQADQVVTEASNAQDQLALGQTDRDKSHVIIVPRPPEWVLVEKESTDSDSSFSYVSGDETEDEDTGHTPANEASQPVPDSRTTVERGVMISLPNLELHGIELLELVTLSLTIKCERCKDTMDLHNIKSSKEGHNSSVRMESCQKCANQLDVSYRMDMMHANSARAGYLDLDGCTVVDLLPSHFIPVCSECSTPYPAPGVVSVRGESAMAICREDHRKMIFRIPEVKFLLVTPATIRASRAPTRKQPKERLGIVAGQELPRRGRCSHYGKSFRWFRFSCCNKVYACDRCHDETSDHPNEHANRMICGFCSREQNYRPEDCGICHTTLIGRRGTGFWEGGKGTRDRVRMSRKDPRKYRNIHIR